MPYSYRVFVDSSGVGHAFIGIYGPNEQSEIWGFYPKVEGSPSGPGELVDDGKNRKTGEPELHPYDWKSRQIEITAEQHQRMKEHALWVRDYPGQYGFLGNNCTEFVEDMLEKGVGRPKVIGTVMPIDLRDELRLEEIINGAGKWIANTVSTTFLAARTVAPARRDPLVLDLDGDGLETVGIDTKNPTLFDHDGDGVKTATGWVTPDDAFLVLERNDDGRIDSGSELFGDATPLAAGTTAADGFAALAQEDTNSDGLVNASDERFANLRLWRDANQDGISQADELITLASQDISALKVGRTANSTLLANGNQIADLGGFVRNDGSDGTLGAVEQLADINLASSPFYSEFTDSIPLTEQAQTLPELQGAGMVRSLRQAGSLPTDQGRELATQLVAFAAETTRSGQMAKLDSLLKAWAETSSMATTASGAFAGVNLTLSFAGATKDTPDWQAWLDKLSILERFNGQTFLPVPATGTTQTIDFYSTREMLLEASFAALGKSVYDALVTQTRLKPYLDRISLSIDENGIAMNFSAMEAANDNQRRTWA